MLWDSWESIMRVAIVTVTSYVGLLLLQRVSGKRTLSKLNAFDLIVTVALGSMLATTILSPNATLARGLTGIGVLMALQLAVTFLSVRVPLFKRLVKASPSLLVRDGQVLDDALRRERVTPDEVLQAVRSAGHTSLEGLHVVLETNGKMSVVSGGDSEPTALAGLQ